MIDIYKYLIRILNSYSIFFRVYDGISYGRKKKFLEKRIFTRTDHIIPRQILKLISLEYELRSKR